MPTTGASPYHYGMRGAVAGLVMGTVLFTSIQLLVALRLDAEDWRITVPIYAAYGTIAISVGDRKSTRLNSSHGYISYAVFCLKKKKKYILIDREECANAKMEDDDRTV